MITLSDRIKEISYIIGTGNIALSGSVNGFSTFSSAYTNNSKLFYAITDGKFYEIGSGVYSLTNNDIQRFPIKSTSNNNKVSFTAGLKEVYVTYPASHAVYNTSGINPTPRDSGIAFWTSANSLSYSDKIVFDSGKGALGINRSNPLFPLDVNGVIRSSGLLANHSGIIFPSGLGNLVGYSGGTQLTHFEMNNLDNYCLQKGLIGNLTGSNEFIELSGSVNQYILLKKQSAGTVFAGPTGDCVPPCNPSYPAFRPLVATDIPALPYSPISHNHTSSHITNFESSVNIVNNNPSSVVRSVSGIVAAVSGDLVTASARITAVSGHFQTSINNISDTLASAYNNICGGRLSLSPSQSVFDGSGTSLYFVPHDGNSIFLYDGTSWNNVNFSSKTVRTFSSLNSGTIYDVFGYLNGNDISFELTSWTMYSPPSEEEPDLEPLNSYRSTSISKFQGVWCKTSNNTRRYIGTIRTGSSAFIDNQSNRWVCNANNKVKKILYSDVLDVNNEPYFTFSWIYNSSVFRKIPYIPEVSVVNGLDSNIDLKIILDCSIPYVRTEYILGIIKSPEVYIDSISSTYDDILYYIDNDAYFYNYSSVVLSNTTGLVTTDMLSGDSQDGTKKTLSASIYCKPVGYEKFYGIEKATFGTPIIYGNRLLGNYGIMGTYEC